MTRLRTLGPGELDALHNIAHGCRAPRARAATLTRLGYVKLAAGDPAPQYQPTDQGLAHLNRSGICGSAYATPPTTGP